MAKADLHLHSKYSNHPSEWFLQRLGASESYTEPEYIYKTSIEKGMTFVTVTDHNKIDASLSLKELYPERAFTGVEVTTYFPENQCKIHVLVYGLNEKQFDEIQSIRKDIYDLRHYLRREKLTHSVAHATFSVNGKLSFEHLEKLILLFDVFEGINGGRNEINNLIWMKILSNLTPVHIEDLYSKYRIEPFSHESWKKGFTGGSDDHAGMFIGRTFTETEADSIDSFLAKIRAKESYPSGRHNDYQSLAFMFYKIAYDFSKNKQESISTSFLDTLMDYFFGEKNLDLKNKIALKKLKAAGQKNGNKIYMLLHGIIHDMERLKTAPLENKLNLAYQKIAEIADEFFKILLQSIEKDIQKGNFIKIITNLSASIPGIFLSIPFFSTIKIMSDSRKLLSELKEKYLPETENNNKRILWFSDTLNDLNGVSITLRKIRQLAAQKKSDLVVAGSFDSQRDLKEYPQNTLDLPIIFSFQLPGYEQYTLKIPSVLKSLESIYDYKPDEIIISTPGPIGLVGLMAAKLLNIKSVGIYHTDFKLHGLKITKDKSMANFLGSYVKSFYSLQDEILVSSKEYIRILENRGIKSSKMKIFPRGIDTDLFSPNKTEAEEKYKLGFKNGFNLLYSGRISKDKELDFLIEVFSHLSKKTKDINLIITGSGPYFNDLRIKTKEMENIFFTGVVDHKFLHKIYSAADLFVFPSVADTFGMVILEAQSCGLPAIVSDRGGPQEIIINHKTGIIAEAGNLSDWIRKIMFIKDMKDFCLVRYNQMKKLARENVLKIYTWDRVLDEIIN